MQDKLLQDPAVQAKLKEAGEKALNDPAVQQMIVKVAKDKFPEYAGKAADAAKAWAQDPAVQAKAKEYGAAALALASKELGEAGDKVIGLIEQGPTGVRILTFGAECMCCATAVMALINVGEALGALAVYVVSVYQLLFAITAMTFEAPATVIEKIPGLTHYQDMIMEKAKFMSEVLGRGIFYIFQGTLWLAFASFAKMLNFLTGVVMICIGLLHIAMHYGQLQTVASKMKAGYEKVQQQGP